MSYQNAYHNNSPNTLSIHTESQIWDPNQTSCQLVDLDPSARVAEEDKSTSPSISEADRISFNRAKRLRSYGLDPTLTEFTFEDELQIVEAKTKISAIRKERYHQRSTKQMEQKQKKSRELYWKRRNEEFKIFSIPVSKATKEDIEKAGEIAVRRARTAWNSRQRYLRMSEEQRKKKNRQRLARRHRNGLGRCYPNAGIYPLCSYCSEAQKLNQDVLESQGNTVYSDGHQNGINDYFPDGTVTEQMAPFPETNHPNYYEKASNVVESVFHDYGQYQYDLPAHMHNVMMDEPVVQLPYEETPAYLESIDLNLEQQHKFSNHSYNWGNNEPVQSPDNYNYSTGETTGKYLESTFVTINSQEDSIRTSQNELIGETVVELPENYHCSTVDTTEYLTSTTTSIDYSRDSPIFNGSADGAVVEPRENYLCSYGETTEYLENTPVSINSHEDFFDHSHNELFEGAVVQLPESYSCSAGETTEYPSITTSVSISNEDNFARTSNNEFVDEAVIQLPENYSCSTGETIEYLGSTPVDSSNQDFTSTANIEYLESGAPSTDHSDSIFFNETVNETAVQPLDTPPSISNDQSSKLLEEAAQKILNRRARKLELERARRQKMSDEERRERNKKSSEARRVRRERQKQEKRKSEGVKHVADEKVSESLPEVGDQSDEFGIFKKMRAEINKQIRTANEFIRGSKRK